MRIVFNEKAGKIASIIHSLNHVNNFDSLIATLEAENINMDLDIKDDLCLIKTQLKEKADDLDFFFGKESAIWKALVYTAKLWECNNIQQFINCVKKLDEIEIKQRLYIKLNRDKEQKVNLEAEKIINNNKHFFYYIKDLKINEKEKWNLLCFIEDVDLYVKRFIELIEEYLPIYDNLHDKYKNEELEICNRIQKHINHEEIRYIEDLTKPYVEFRDYREVHVTVSVFNNYNLNFAIENDVLYLYLGLRYEANMKKNIRADEMDQSLLVFKNVAEKTRFEIVKFLLHGEHFGQEIAEKLQISTAAVSYQMNYLFAANLVKIKKVDRKVYYVLNKDTVRKAIEFLERELEL
ncbi:MAG: winged helix-turn-helix transcriptional regulator [Clostridiaceae bacterium]|nr:winged helix-turn-helix transcriptional regulator [Clostridiaceae bacterium]